MFTLIKVLITSWSDVIDSPTCHRVPGISFIFLGIEWISQESCGYT